MQLKILGKLGMCSDWTRKSKGFLIMPTDKEPTNNNNNDEVPTLADTSADTIDIQYKNENKVENKPDINHSQGINFDKVLADKKVLTDKKEAVEKHQTMIIKIINITGNTIIKNGDVGTGGISYILFGFACTYLEQSRYFQALLFFIMSIILSFVKKKFPEGDITRNLQKIVTKINAEESERF